MNRIQQAIINNYEKRILKRIEKDETTEKEWREKTIKKILSMGEYFEIETEDGKTITEEDLKALSTKELVEILNLHVQEMKKELGEPS